MANHFEIMVEERSMEEFLRALFSQTAGNRFSYNIYPFQGKMDLMQQLPDRLRAYATWLPDNWRIIIVVDRDDEDCRVIKQNLDQFAEQSGLRKRAPSEERWQVVNRIAIEELEAWYFGDWPAVKTAYPRVDEKIPQRAPYRNSDAIAGGTWEAFERVLKKAGYFQNGLRKIEAARMIGRHMTPKRNTSQSFQSFWQIFSGAVAQ